MAWAAVRSAPGKIGKEDEYDYKKVCLDGPVFDLKEVL